MQAETTFLIATYIENGRVNALRIRDLDSNRIGTVRVKGVL